MRRALFEFYAPGRALAQCAAIAAALSALLCVAPLRSEFVPWLACAAAWAAGNGWSRLMIRSAGELEHSWPVAEPQAFWTRVLAAWSFCWVPALASQLAVNLLYAFGAVTTERWLPTLGQSACLSCVTPLFSALVQFIDARATASAAFAGLLALLMATVPLGGLVAGIHGVFPPWPFDVALLALAFGLVHLSRGGARRARPLASAAAQRDFSPTRQLEGGPARARERRWVAARFFYRQGTMVWLVWFLVGFVSLASLGIGRVNLLLWTILSTTFLNTYWGTPGQRSWVAYLPISRDRMFVWVLAPLCLLAVGTIGVEAVWGVRFPARVTYAHMRENSDPSERLPVDSERRSLDAPALYWRATLGEPAPVRTSSGELHQIASYPVISGLPLRVYNPFDAWQWEDPFAFADHVSQTLREQYQLPVTAEDVLRADPAAPRSIGKERFGCFPGGLQATCGWPWAWLALKFGLLALITWSLASVLLHRRYNGRRHEWGRFGWVLLCWGVVMALNSASDALQRDEPARYTWFEGAVLLAELARALQRHPLLVGGSGALLLALLYWHLLRRYREAELWGRAS